nr:nucleolin-like [Nicotiana tomentosiformis]
MDKTTKMNPVPDRKFKRREVVDNVVKQALVTWGDSSGESESDDKQGDSSMMDVESKAAQYDSIFALTAKSDEDEDDDDDDDDDEENFLDVQRILRKILRVLPTSWERKSIMEAKDLQKLMIDKLIGNLKTYEMKKKKDQERRESKKKKNLVLKADNSDSSGDDADMAYHYTEVSKNGSQKRRNP